MSAAAATPQVPSGAVLLAQGVCGADTSGLRGAARGAVYDLFLALGRGVHAVLGAPEDGTIAFGDLVSGRVRPSRGVLKIAGAEPSRDAASRRRIAHLAPGPELPDARDVASAATLATAARRGGDALAMLDRLGAGQLRSRRLVGLTHGEARAVDAALALSAPSPLVVVAHEPFADVGPASATAIEIRLRELAAEGAVVLLLTSSPRDASRVADAVLVLDRGRIVRGAGAAGNDLIDPPAWPHARPRRVELVAHVAGGPPGQRGGDDASPGRAMARRLAASSAVTSVSFEEPPHGEPGPTSLRVAGLDEAACALALLDAADAEHAAIVSLAPVPATLVEVRMATDQLRIAATWHARMHAMLTPDAMTLTAAAHVAAEGAAETAAEPHDAAPASPAPLAIDDRAPASPGALGGDDAATSDPDGGPA